MAHRASVHPDNNLNLLRRPEDWVAWKFRMQTRMKSLGIMAIIDGTYPRPIGMMKTMRSLHGHDNNDAMHNLVERLHSDIVNHVTSTTTAAQIWTTLLNLFENRSETNLCAIIKQFYQYKHQPGMKMQQYITKTRSLAAACANVGVEISDALLVAVIVGGLPRLYEQVVLSFESKPIENQTINELTAAILRKKMLDVQHSSDSGQASGNGHTSSETTALAHAVRNNNFQRTGRQGFRHPGDQRFGRRDDGRCLRFRGRCDACGRNGHRASECRSNPQYNTRNDAPSRSDGRFDRRPLQVPGNRDRPIYGQPNSQFNDNNCFNNNRFNNNRIGNDRRQSDQRNHQFRRNANFAAVDDGQDYENQDLFDAPEQVGAFSATVRNNLSFAPIRITLLDTKQRFSAENIWCGDSGAGGHMTGHREWFSSYEPVSPSCIEVVLENNHVLSVVGVGDIPIVTANGRRFAMRRVLHVPDLRRNLFSLSEVAEKDYEVRMRGRDLSIYGGSDFNDLLLTGVLIAKGFYCMNFCTANRAADGQVVSFSAMSTAAKPSSVNVWHHRLGHTNYSTVQRMTRSNSVSRLNCSDDIVLAKCVPCIQGKMHRQSFAASSSRSFH